MFSLLGIAVLVLIVWILYIYILHPAYPAYEYENFKKKYKTGDIILFHALDNINPIFIGCYYGHVGIVFVDPDDATQTPYIFEAFCQNNMLFYPDECKKGIAFSQLEHRMATYRGYCFYKELEYTVSPEVQRGMRDLIKYAIDNMYYNDAVFINAFKKIVLGDNLQNGTNCGELVYLSLIKLGLLPQEYLHKNRTHHLLWISNLVHVNANAYRDPVYILSNYFKL